MAFGGWFFVGRAVHGGQGCHHPGDSSLKVRLWPLGPWFWGDLSSVLSPCCVCGSGEELAHSHPLRTSWIQPLKQKPAPTLLSREEKLILLGQAEPLVPLPIPPSALGSEHSWCFYQILFLSGALNVTPV